MLSFMVMFIANKLLLNIQIVCIGFIGIVAAFTFWKANLVFFCHDFNDRN